MRLAFLSVVFAVILFVVRAGALDAVELTTPEQVKAELSKPGPIVLMYATDWCGACKTMKPIFMRAAKENKNTRFFILNADKVRLKEHQDLGFVPRIYVGRNEKELRENPCNDADGTKQSTTAIKELVDRCTKN